MALNDFANSPPPTGVPLSIVNQANAGASYFAPASGGGGGGAISTFDSIRLNSISSIGSEVVIGQNLAVANAIACSVISTVSVTPLNSGDPVTISSLSVSSLNGAAPGGVVSTFGNIVTDFIAPSPGNDTAFIASGGAFMAVDLPGNIADLQMTVSTGQSAAIGFNGTSVWVGGKPGNEGGVPVSISTLNVSTINGAPFAAQGDGYNVAPWQASGIIVGSQGIFSGVLNLGGNLSGGNWASTINLPPFINFVATNNMTGNVVSGAYGSGGLTNTAIQFPSPSSISVSAQVAGTIGTLFISVQGSATGFL